MVGKRSYFTYQPTSLYKRRFPNPTKLEGDEKDVLHPNECLSTQLFQAGFTTGSSKGMPNNITQAHTDEQRWKLKSLLFDFQTQYRLENTP